MVASRFPTALIHGYALRIKPVYESQSPPSQTISGSSCAFPNSSYRFGNTDGFQPLALTLDNPGATGWLTFRVDTAGYYSFAATAIPEAPARAGIDMYLLDSVGTIQLHWQGTQGKCLALGSYRFAISDTTGGIYTFGLLGQHVLSISCP
jgi:hypothetical protein